MGSSAVQGANTVDARRIHGVRGHEPAAGDKMTRQYLAGELSVLLEHLQAVTFTEAAGRDAWSLRHAAETEPIPALGSVTVRALALADGLCWDSLNRGDTAAFTRQLAVFFAELHELPACAPACSRRLR